MSGQLWDCVERDLQTAAGMPHGYYLILAMLSEAPDRSLRMNQLARVVWSSQSRVSHAVARLEETGWVHRSPSPGDRRGQIATLTDEGWERLIEVAPSHAETVRSDHLRSAVRRAARRVRRRVRYRARRQQKRTGGPGSVTRPQVFPNT